MSNSTNTTMKSKIRQILIGWAIGAAVVALIMLILWICGVDMKPDKELQKKLQTEYVWVYRAVYVNCAYGGGHTFRAKYDAYGRIIQVNKDRNPYTDYNYQYDEEGNLSDVWIYSRDEKYVTLESKHIRLSYNSEGTMVLRQDFFGGQREQESAADGTLLHEYHYNAYGELTEEYEFDIETHEKKVLVDSKSNEDGKLVTMDGVPVTVVYTSDLVRETYAHDPIKSSLSQDLYSTEELYPDGRIKTKTYWFDDLDSPKQPLDDSDIVKLEPRPDLAEKEIHMKYDGESRVVDYYIEREFNKSGQVLSERCFNGDGSPKWLKSSVGFPDFSGYYWEFDEHGNPVYACLHTEKGNELLYVINYESFGIPKEYLCDDEEHYIGIRHLIID